MAKIPLRTPAEYFQHLEQVKEFISEGILVLEKGTCPLEDLPHSKDEPWPSDIIEHIFSCAECKMQFRLWVDTYHGGGEWSAIIP